MFDSVAIGLAAGLSPCWLKQMPQNKQVPLCPLLSTTDCYNRRRNTSERIGGFLVACDGRSTNVYFWQKGFYYVFMASPLGEPNSAQYLKEN